MIFNVLSKPNHSMRARMETLLGFKPPLGLELIFSYGYQQLISFLAILSRMCYWSFQISCLKQPGVLPRLIISPFSRHLWSVQEKTWGTRENMRHPGLVICITPSLTFPLISCIPDYNPGNSAFWSYVWKCRKWKVRDRSGPIAMWFNSMAMSWCDKPCKSLKKCEE